MDELPEIKAFITKNPAYNASAVLYTYSYQQINQDQVFFNAMLKLDNLNYNLVEELLVRNPRLSDNIEFAKKCVMNYPDTQTAVKLWRLHTDTMLKDKKFILTVIKASPLSDVVASFVNTATETLEKDYDIVRALLRENRFDIGFSIHQAQLSRDRDFVKDIMKKNPLSKIAKKVWAANTMTLATDAAFVKEFLNMAKEMWDRTKRGVGTDLIFVKEMVQLAPNSIISMEIWNTHKDKLAKDIPFAKGVIQSTPTSNIASELWKAQKLELSKDILFVKNVVILFPISKIATELWAKKKTELSQDIDFVKEFITKNLDSELTYKMWLRTEDDLMTDSSFIISLMQRNPVDKLSNYVCSNIKHQDNHDFQLELCAAIEHTSVCGRILECADLVH